MNDLIYNSCNNYLYRVLKNLSIIMKHNFFASVIALSSSILAFHYSTLKDHLSCPLAVLLGQSQTGKTTTLRLALSMIGMLMTILADAYIMSQFQELKRSPSMRRQQMPTSC